MGGGDLHIVSRRHRPLISFWCEKTTPRCVRHPTTPWKPRISKEAQRLYVAYRKGRQKKQTGCRCSFNQTTRGAHTSQSQDHHNINQPSPARRAHIGPPPHEPMNARLRNHRGRPRFSLFHVPDHGPRRAPTVGLPKRGGKHDGRVGVHPA